MAIGFATFIFPKANRWKAKLFVFDLKLAINPQSKQRSTNFAGRGQNREFKYVNGQWFQDGDLENNSIVYASDAWIGHFARGIGYRLVLRLEFRQGDLAGELTKFKVGAPTQLLIHTSISAC